MTRGALRQAVLALCAAVLAALALAATASAARPSHGPTPQQIGAAIASVGHSRALWATVNACHTPREPNTIGVRAQMPALGFATRMTIGIAVEYRNATGTFVPVPGSGATYTARLGDVTDGTEQAGSSFDFGDYHGTLRGIATFTWRRSGRVLLRLTRVSTAGHHDADGGDPAHYSAAVCVFP